MQRILQRRHYQEASCILIRLHVGYHGNVLHRGKRGHCVAGGRKQTLYRTCILFVFKYKRNQVFFFTFSQMFLSLDLSAAGKQNQNRPKWAAQNLEALPANKDSIKRLSQTSQWNAGIRPGPVRPPVPRLSKEGLRASQRSLRSTPSKPICTFNINLK